MERTFEHRVAVITGAASGIGKTTAMAFAKEGAKVIIADILVDAGEETVSLIKKAGGDAIFILCDVSKPTDIEVMVNITIEAFGRLDYAFNNAGIEGQQALTADCSLENWERVININLRGVWLCMKYQIPQMLKQKKGVIVNCASVAGLVGFAGIPAYTASKHGIIGLTKAAALEYAKQGIRVNAVCPGVIRTPMVERFTHRKQEAEAQLIAGEPMGRLGEPQEIAEAVLWLCSDAASFVTGHSMVIDGGWIAQ